MKLDQAWIDAEVNRDRATSEQILDEPFIVTFSSGRIVDRTAFIDLILSKPIAPFEVIHDVVLVYDDTAIVLVH
jgi:hypothetical protein